MKRLLVICVALTGACRDHELERMTAVRDEVCACKTVACAEAALASVPKAAIEPSARSQRLAREMLDCLADLYALDRPTMDPDAESVEP